MVSFPGRGGQISPMRAAPLLIIIVATALFSCFHQTGPEDPTPVSVPPLVTVTIQYRQPSACLNITSPCDGRVVFFGSWMPAGNQILLTEDPSTFVWTGTASNVPVNFPPTDSPYYVRIYDPYLRDLGTGGITADRLAVGGQALTKFEAYGSPAESALVYIDARGIGHNPF
jgi:hypothetical protein